MNYTVRHACFAVTTPYQLIGAISIVLREKIDADLYLFGMFGGYAETAKRVEEEHIFKNVFCVDPGPFQFTRKGTALFQILCCRKTVSAFLPDNVSYEVYYTTSRAHVKTLMIHELRRRNPHMTYVIYEDGIGTYRPGKLAIVTSKKRQRFEKILGWKMFEREKTTIMAYEPSMVEVNSDLTNQPVQSMPRLIMNSENIDLLRRIFSVGDQDQIHARVIVFDNIRFGDDNKDRLMDQCIDDLLSVVDKKEIICKPHPRSLSTSKTGIEVYSSPSVPIEALYATMEDLEDKILISCTSTATMTPRLLFGKEPIIIDIYPLINHSVNGDNEALYAKIQSMYQNKDRVICVTTHEELINTVDRLMRSTNQ